MDTRSLVVASFLLALGSVHCAQNVLPHDETPDGGRAPTPDAGGGDDAPAPDALVPTTPPPATPGCAEVRAACPAAPALVVRGHASGLDGALEGARVQFAVRYVRAIGAGLAVPHGVAMARAQVRGGAFEACVCVPEGANAYPELAAVIYAPGTASETSRDARRVMFSQRYATLGDEDVSDRLAVAPQAPEVEAAVAAMVERTATVTLDALSDPAVQDARVIAGLVADERPVAAQLASGVVSGARVELAFLMPGRAWPGERLVLLVDRNANHRCDTGDLGATAPLDDRTTLSGVGSDGWLAGDALQPVCDALRVEAERGL